MSIATYLTALDRDRDALAANLTTKGVPASSSETFTTLVPKVLDIPSGGGGDIEWNTATVTTLVPQGTTNSTFTTLGYGIKKLTAENLTIQSPAQNSNWCIGFPNIEELTFKNCKFGNTGMNYGPTISNASVYLGLMKKLTLKNCTISVGNSQTYNPLQISLSGIDIDVIIDGLTIETGRTNIKNLFAGSTKMKTISISNITVNNCTEFSYMFSNCSSLTSIDLSSLIVTPTKVDRMFNGCTSLATLDISGLDCTGISSSSNYTNMFNNVPTTCTIYVKDAANQTWFSSKFSGYTFTIKS